MTARSQAALLPRKAAVPSRATAMLLRTSRALWLTLAMLALSLLLVVLGVYTTTRSQSLSVTGYTSGVILTLGSFLGLLGLCLEENRKQLLTAAIVFLSCGVVAAFVCLLIDGVCVIMSMDMRPLRAGRCQFYSSGGSGGGGGSFIYENFFTSVSCWSLKESCSLTVRSGTCYCCDLYDCANGGYLSNYYEFVGVQSCEEVLTLYVLIWILSALNLLAFFSAILTTALLGNIKHTRQHDYIMEASENAESSPTAPLLMDTNSVGSVRQLHLGVAGYFPSAEQACASLTPCPPSGAQPPPFAPSWPLTQTT